MNNNLFTVYHGIAGVHFCEVANIFDDILSQICVFLIASGALIDELLQTVCYSMHKQEKFSLDIKSSLLA